MTRLASWKAIALGLVVLAACHDPARQDETARSTARPDRQAVEPARLDPLLADATEGLAIVVGRYSLIPTTTGEALGPSGACFRCHGLDGRGDAATATPRLSNQVYKYLYDSLRDYASGVRSSDVMEPIARELTQEQMRDVSAYYALQASEGRSAPPAAEPQLLQLGGTLAAVGSAEQGVQACANCHGPQGIGLPPTYPYLAGQHAIYMEMQLRAWQTGARKGDGFGIMEMIARRMTAEQIRAVSLYYAAMQPPFLTPETYEAAAPSVPLPGETTRPLGR